MKHSPTYSRSALQLHDYSHYYLHILQKDNDIMRVNNWKLTDTFLTKAATVGMQWTTKQGDRLTIWLDHKGKLCNTSSTTIPVNVYTQCLDYYEKKCDTLLNETLVG